MQYFVWSLLAALVVLHQCGWVGDGTRLLFGFLPTELAYHVGISLAAGAAWWLATIYAWPVDDEAVEAAGGEPR